MMTRYVEGNRSMGKLRWTDRVDTIYSRLYRRLNATECSYPMSAKYRILSTRLDKLFEAREARADRLSRIV